ncbi:potassium-transporting ATPase subunit F [Paenibacillus sp. FSL P2-0136]|nr:hypothetical protein BK146_04450 [Paenibacillus sp. FSL R7-0333]
MAVVLAATVLLFLYLGYALIHPEKF